MRFGGWGGKTLGHDHGGEDRTTCVLFGDGAGAAVLTKSGEGSSCLGSSVGRMDRIPLFLHQPAGGSALPATIDLRYVTEGHFLKMNGREIFKSAVRVMERASRELLPVVDLDKSEVDHVIPHQANARIVESLSQRLEIPPGKVLLQPTNMEVWQLPFRSPWMKRSKDTKFQEKVTLDCL